VVGLTLNINPVLRIVALTPEVQVSVPVQLAAVKVTESPEQTEFLLAVTVGVWPKPPTDIAFEAIPAQVPTVHVNVYVVFVVGLAVIVGVVALVDHKSVPVQLPEVNVIVSPPQVLSLEAVIVGVGDAVFIETFIAFEAKLAQKLTVQVAVYVVATVGVTVIEAPD
jgi:hypothetical protein